MLVNDPFVLEIKYNYYIILKIFFLTQRKKRDCYLEILVYLHYNEKLECQNKKLVNNIHGFSVLKILMNCNLLLLLYNKCGIGHPTNDVYTGWVKRINTTCYIDDG